MEHYIKIFTSGDEDGSRWGGKRTWPGMGKEMELSEVWELTQGFYWLKEGVSGLHVSPVLRLWKLPECDLIHLLGKAGWCHDCLPLQLNIYTYGIYKSQSKVHFEKMTNVLIA